MGTTIEHLAARDEIGIFALSATVGRVHLLTPDLDRLFFDDAAITLPWALRYNCHLRFSVAQHLVVCLRAAIHLGITDQKLLRTILLHDVHESWIGDVVSPIKKLPGCEGLAELEDIWLQACAERFDLIYPHPDIVDRIDKASAAVEMATRPDVELVVTPETAEVVEAVRRRTGAPWSPEYAQAMFCEAIKSVTTSTDLWFNR